MAGVNPKKVGPGPELLVQKYQRQLHGSKMLRHDLIQEVKEEHKINKLIAKREDRLKEDFKRNLDLVRKQNQELTTERDSLLQQLQQEMSRTEAGRQQLFQHEKSQQ